MEAKFVVDTYHQVNEDAWCEINYRGDDPWLAIQVWAEAERKNRTCASINVITREHACELIDYAYNNIDKVMYLCEAQRVSYKESYLRDAIIKAHEKRCEPFHDGTEDWERDQVHPFCLG